MGCDSPKNLAAPAVECTNVLTPCPIEVRTIVSWERPDFVTLASWLLQRDKEFRGHSPSLNGRLPVDIGIEISDCELLLRQL